MTSAEPRVRSASTVDRPLTLAEIFDRAVTLVVRRFPAVLILGGVTAVPIVLSGLVQALGGKGESAAGVATALRFFANPVTMLEAVVTVVALALLCATMTVAALDYRVRPRARI